MATTVDACETHFTTIADAVDAIARGEIVIVVDDPGRENEGDFVMAAELATPEAVNFMITHGRGLLCTPIASAHADRLDLRTQPGGGPTAFTTTVDLASAHTGISAPERAECIRRLVARDATADEFVSPGHVFPLRAQPGGVLERPGHTEASCDLARLAGLNPAGMICEILNDDGTMARVDDLTEIARRHGMPMITIADLIAHRLATEPGLEFASKARIPTPYGDFTAHCYVDPNDDLEHVALVLGRTGADGALVRVHAECIMGDVLAGAGCACGADLRESMRRIALHGRGTVVYVRSPDSLIATCPPVTGRELGIAARIIGDLGLGTIRLLGATSDSASTLGHLGVDVDGIVPFRRPDNVIDLPSASPSLDVAEMA